MTLDSLGLPKIDGATDLQDSAMFAGMLETFDYPGVIPLRMYVIARGKYVRHPRERIYSFSRDQTVPLFAGLLAQKQSDLVDPDYKTEGDIVPPDVRGHFRRCAGLKANWFQDLVLWVSIYWHIKIKPTHESNQIFCILYTHPDDKYIKYFCKNYDWRASIREYYYGWRNEPQFAEHMIDQIEKRINGNPKADTLT